MRDLSIGAVKGMLLSLPLLVALALLVEGAHWLVWRESALAAAFRPLGLGAIVGIFAASVVAHEAIHGIAWKAAARMRGSDVAYGMLWKSLTPYAHPRVPIPARAYRIGAAMPGIALGLVPALVGVATGAATLSGWGALLLSLACGDLLILLRIRSVPGDARVRDHPTRFGCVVLDPDASPAPVA